MTFYFELNCARGARTITKSARPNQNKVRNPTITMTEEVLFDHLHAQLVDYTLQNNKVS